MPGERRPRPQPRSPLSAVAAGGGASPARRAQVPRSPPAPPCHRYFPTPVSVSVPAPPPLPSASPRGAGERRSAELRRPPPLPSPAPAGAARARPPSAFLSALPARRSRDAVLLRPWPAVPMPRVQHTDLAAVPGGAALGRSAEERGAAAPLCRAEAVAPARRAGLPCHSTAEGDGATPGRQGECLLTRLQPQR